ncbi:GNAT family N-acetyltransferase [Nakamurella sp. YIM 132087]|uniref:GNAT family N-acetyltransferase n=1 Tax=Nakamurella alba TaxID=2665158 RepID=A0A7K1FPW9_9ACTN|nr:GNAT family N-acetyltransferase [Nakamurella alba]MTD16110.1 GNAT family N-acetyltransferase [Nakamurella alba]
MSAADPTVLADPTLGAPVLDNPAWAALTGPHAAFAQRLGHAARYHPDVAGFAAVQDISDPAHWADLRRLVGPGAEVSVSGEFTAPAGWRETFAVPGVQLVDVELVTEPDAEAVRLGAADVPEMLDLVARTQPGPFRVRTVELGTYLGIRRDGVLVAMAGERLHPPGWTEISAVCTAPEVRGQGLATRLVRAVAFGIAGRGERAFLHTSAANTTAIRLYTSIGFRLRRTTRFRAFVSPG